MRLPSERAMSTILFYTGKETGKRIKGGGGVGVRGEEKEMVGATNQ